MFYALPGSITPKRRIAGDLLQISPVNNFINIEFPFIKCSENETEFEGLTFRKINSNRMDVQLRLKGNNGHGKNLIYKMGLPTNVTTKVLV